MQTAFVISVIIEFLYFKIKFVLRTIVTFLIKILVIFVTDDVIGIFSIELEDCFSAGALVDGLALPDVFTAEKTNQRSYYFEARMWVVYLVVTFYCDHLSLNPTEAHSFCKNV